MSSKKSTWPRQAAIVVSDSPNVHMMIRELLRSYQWTIADSTPHIMEAVSAIRNGQAYLVILDDTLALPATRHLRVLLSDPVCVCTPVLTFLMEPHKGETNAIKRLGQPHIVEKPLTPSKFVPGFVNLVRVWEREPYVSLRKANYHFLNGEDTQGIRALGRLAENVDLRQTCAQALALHLRHHGKIKEAETLLLAALKQAPRELGTMVGLADLYMHAAMPKLAHRLLTGARAAFGHSMAIIPDLVQAALLMGDLQDVIGNLYVLHKAGVAEEETSAFLARVLYAEGREAEAERILNNNRATFKKVESSWTQAESPPTTPLSSAS